MSRLLGLEALSFSSDVTFCLLPAAGVDSDILTETRFFSSHVSVCPVVI